MNDRIIELRKEAYNLVQIDLQTNERDEVVDNREHLKMVFDKFAELIVRECIRHFNEDYQRDFDTLWREDLTNSIKNHFGVE